MLPLRRVFQTGRNFLVADVGATTTDIAVVRIGTDQRPYCYSAKSAPVGVDLLDEQLIGKGATGVDVLSLRVGRAQKSAATSATAAVAAATDPLRRMLTGALQVAMGWNPDKKGWSTFYVVTVGGGSRVPALRQVVLSAQAWGWVENRQQPGLALEKPKVAGHSSKPPLQHEEYELVSVLGSAVPAWEAGDWERVGGEPVIPKRDTDSSSHRRPVPTWV